MEWDNVEEKSRGISKEENDRRIWIIALTIILLIALSTVSNLAIMTQPGPHEGNLILFGDDETWYHGWISLRCSDEVETVTLVVNGPLTTTYPNGTETKDEFLNLNFYRDFSEPTMITLSFNCIGQNATIGPFNYMSNHFGILYSDNQGQQIRWEPRG
ncbi:MAG: hypothetical protein ACW98Y_02245 [Candidatus Thorarchaeota archaeon]|jgi:hypothetical protein